MPVRVASAFNALAVVCLVVAAVREGTFHETLGSASGGRYVIEQSPSLTWWLVAGALLLATGTALLVRNGGRARAGALVTLAAITCIVVASFEHRRVHYAVRGSDFTGFFEVERPTVLPWLIAAAALALLGTAMLLRDQRRATR